jgi:hypothetical protein
LVSRRLGVVRFVIGECGSLAFSVDLGECTQLLAIKEANMRSYIAILLLGLFLTPTQYDVGFVGPQLDAFDSMLETAGPHTPILPTQKD